MDDNRATIKQLTELLGKAQDVLQLAVNEFNVIHALCDRAEVPREHEGSKLSAAQRVTVLESVWRDIRTVYRGSAPTFPTQQ